MHANFTALYIFYTTGVLADGSSTLYRVVA